jgi:hypothetical protein
MTRALATLVAIGVAFLLMVGAFVTGAHGQPRWTAPPGDVAEPSAAQTAGVALPEAPAGELSLPVVRARGRIVVRAQAGLESLAEQLASRADGDLRRISADLPDLAVPARVELRVVHDAADMARAAPPGRGAPLWAEGVAYPDLGVLVLATRRSGTPIDAVHVSSHELAHLALGAALGNHAPRWLHEGFAWQHSPDMGMDRTETLAGMAWLGTVIPIDDLDRSFPAQHMAVARAYAQSYDFVSFLARRGRWDDAADDGDRWPFRRFLRYLAEKDDVDAAAIRAYGRPLRTLFTEWRSDLRSRYLYYPAALLVGALWVFAALLLVLAYLRRRRQARRRLGEWGEQERRADAAARAATVAPPPFVAWPGQTDPLAEPGPTPSEAADYAEIAVADGVPDLIGDGELADDDDEDDDDDDDRPDPPRRWIN